MSDDLVDKCLKVICSAQPESMVACSNYVQLTIKELNKNYHKNRLDITKIYRQWAIQAIMNNQHMEHFEVFQNVRREFYGYEI